MQAEILHQPEWARTSLGTAIELYRKGHTEEGARPLLFVGGVHGDEPEGVRLAQDLLAWLKTDEAVNVRPWILIPNINPDGAARGERTNGRGVDLNRNFPSPDWSPEAKAPRYNPGEAAGSEIETRALCKLLDEAKPEVVIHFHSWKPCIVYTGAAGKPWSDALAEGTGYESREDIGYPTPGSLGQYAAYAIQTPVVCIEAQEGAPLESVWPTFGPGLRRVLKGERP